jgi:hypothetical protein
MQRDVPTLFLLELIAGLNVPNPIEQAVQGKGVRNLFSIKFCQAERGGEERLNSPA